MAPPVYCLLDCEDAEKWKGHQQCFDHELPQLDTLGKFAAVFITGGHYSAYEDRAWISGLAEWLGLAVKGHPEVKFLGICFGCQILARGLGGQVGRNPSGRFVLKVEDLRVSRELQQHPAYQQALSDLQGAASDAAGAGSAASSLAEAVAAEREVAGALEADESGADTNGESSKSSSSRQLGKASSKGHSPAGQTQPAGAVAAEGGVGGRAHSQATSSSSSSSRGRLRLLESHGDQVLRLPEGAMALAESDTAQYEIWGYGANVLAVQGHPELDCQVAMEKIYPAVTTNMTTEERMASARSLSGKCPDSGLVLGLMKHFAQLGPASSAAASQETESSGNGLAAPAEGTPPAEGAAATAAAALGPPIGEDLGDTSAAESAVTDAVASDSAELAAMPASDGAHQQAASAGRAPAGNSSSSGGSDVEGDVDRALCALGLGVAAELARGPEEYRLLQECNAVTEKRFDHMARVVAQANKVLQAVQAQQGALDPALQAIDALEAQVCQLEGVMAHMEATAARLQHSLDHLAGRGSAR
ncbi:hypothetical protein N2152v2_004095 [Parachlorella kessleri]